MDESAAINALMEALKFYREQHISSAYSTMGFTIIAVGWLITSQPARVFLSSHRWLSFASLVLIIVSYAGYWKMSLGVLQLSRDIAQQLSDHGVDSGLYEHYALTLQGVCGFILMEGLAAAFLMLLIVAVIRDHGKGDGGPLLDA